MKTYYALWFEDVYAFVSKAHRDTFVQSHNAIYVMPISAKMAYKIVPELRYTDPTVCNKVTYRRDSSLA